MTDRHLSPIESGNVIPFPVRTEVTAPGSEYLLIDNPETQAQVDALMKASEERDARLLATGHISDVDPRDVHPAYLGRPVVPDIAIIRAQRDNLNRVRAHVEAGDKNFSKIKSKVNHLYEAKDPKEK